MSNKWNRLKEEKPPCYKQGSWEGLQSDPILIREVSGIIHVGICNRGEVDGKEFCSFYDNNEHFIRDVVAWASLEEYLHCEFDYLYQ
jgi:hypothetical protein